MKFFTWESCFRFFESFGTLLMGIAALRYANSYAYEKKSKRSEASSLILSKIQYFLDEVGQVADERSLYQYKNHPKLISEGTEEEKKPHPEIPSRLIKQKKDELRKNLYDPASKLSLQDSQSVFSKFSELEKYCTSLSSAIYKDLKSEGDHKIEHVRNIIYSYRNSLESFENDFKSILIPIIQGTVFLKKFQCSLEKIVKKFKLLRPTHYLIIGIVLLAAIGLMLGYGFRLNLSPSLPNKLYFGIPVSSVVRGQIIAFSMPQSKVTFAKRVAGIGGDLLEIKEDKIFINGRSECDLSWKPSGLTFVSSCVIPDGFFFALGSSEDSFDSRYEIFGLVPVSAVKEKLWPIY